MRSVRRQARRTTVVPPSQAHSSAPGRGAYLLHSLQQRAAVRHVVRKRLLVRLQVGPG